MKYLPNMISFSSYKIVNTLQALNTMLDVSRERKREGNRKIKRKGKGWKERGKGKERRRGRGDGNKEGAPT